MKDALRNKYVTMCDGKEEKRAASDVPVSKTSLCNYFHLMRFCRLFTENDARYITFFYDTSVVILIASYDFSKAQMAEMLMLLS